jgi:hypothetical protein
MKSQLGKSTIRKNAESNSTYCPNCYKCPGLVRTTMLEPFLWKCRSGHLIDERLPSDKKSPSISICGKCNVVIPLNQNQEDHDKVCIRRTEPNEVVDNLISHLEGMNEKSPPRAPGRAGASKYEGYRCSHCHKGHLGIDCPDRGGTAREVASKTKV